MNYLNYGVNINGWNKSDILFYSVLTISGFISRMVQFDCVSVLSDRIDIIPRNLSITVTRNYSDSSSTTNF